MGARNKMPRNLPLLSEVSLHPIATLVRGWQMLNTGIFNRAGVEFHIPYIKYIYGI
jgi:hypothetical protein